MARLNLKYEGTIIKSEDSSIVPKDEWVLSGQVISFY